MPTSLFDIRNAPSNSSPVSPGFSNSANQAEPTNTPANAPTTPATGLVVSTAGPALKSVNTARTTLQSMQQGAAQQAAAKAAQNPANAVLQNQQNALNAQKPPIQPPNTPPSTQPPGQPPAQPLTPPGGTPPVPAPSQTPSTGNKTADSMINGINGVTAPAAPTTLTDGFGKPITAPPGFTAEDMVMYQKNLVDLQTNQKQAMDTINSTIENIRNGTYPLTAAQQSLLNATNQSFSVAQQYLNAANQGTIQAQISLGARLGQNKYNPSALLHTLTNTYNQAALTMSDIASQQAIAVGKLEESFQKDDLDAINAQATILENSFSEQSSTLNNLLSATQKFQSDMNTYNLNLQKDVADAKQTEFSDAMNNANFTLSQKKDAYDAYIQQANLTETQKQNAFDRWYKTQDLAIKQAAQTLNDDTAAQSWVKNIENGTAKISDVPKNLKDAVSIGLANSGGGNQSQLLETTQKSLQELNNMVNNESWYSFLPGGGTGFHGAVGAKGISSFFGLKDKPAAGTAAGNFYKKLNQVKNDVILPNLNILHGLGRVTDREFQSLTSAVTSLDADLSEDAFKEELKNITDRINEKVLEVNNGGTKEYQGVSLPGNTDSSVEGSTYQGVTLPH